MAEDTSLLKHIDMRLYPCRCCGAAAITADFAALLRLLNDELEKKGWCVRVNSGYRCQKHNAKIGGHPNSRHKVGQAADLHPAFPETVTPSMLKQFIDERLGDADGYNGGLGLYSWGVHIDIGKRSRWTG